MIEISDRLFAAFVGPNYTSHYEDAFARIESGTTRSWNTAAAAVPFWFVYRGLLSWSIIFFLGFLVMYAAFAAAFTIFSWMRYELYWIPIIPAYLTTCIVQGMVADTLLHRRALRIINMIRRSASDQGSAIRQLSQLAPSAPPGVYVRHGVLTLVGMPVWAVAVWIGTTVLTPHYSEPQSVYVALMRATLRDLVVMQESFFFDAARYSNDVSQLRYVLPEGVTVNVTSASDSGWSASAAHVMVAQRCSIFVGRGVAIQNAEEGIPHCPESR